MNNNRLTASKSKAALEEQSYDLIQQHIIDRRTVRCRSICVCSATGCCR